MSVRSRSWSRSYSVSTDRSTDSCGTATTASSVVDGECCLREGGEVCFREVFTPPWESTTSSTTSSTTPSTRASSISEPTRDSKPAPVPVPALELTVGVELEFLLLSPVPTPHTLLYPLLRTALTPLATLLSTTASPLLEPHPETIFQLKTDDTISSNPWGLRAAPIEIATPILRRGDWEWALPALCTAVKSLPGITARVNRSTGLHVHVGLGRPYTLPELKRVAKAVVLLEGCMDANHPRHRIPSDAMGSCYRSVVGSLVFRGCSPWDMVKMVDDCGSVMELLGVVNAVGGGGRGSGWCRLYKYNFTAVVVYGSVEFRQATGTVRGGRVREWVRCVMRFVERAVGTGEEVWEEWAARGEVPRALWRMFGAPSACGWGRRFRERGAKKKKGRRVPMRFRLKGRRKSVYLARRGRGG
ncbi:uncharacterized protein H6S33_002928 [Morchella sextelata]|uniref:uncharacterized protein n=1 Tax=Morchella sextelata TaxID=1174677 RepID=UPI001D0424C2|nr:uncharacterized protein H6S33_002928 [Morchella sextelata]KAH0606940.1 hypothetical protein H6S33_002928 [Morchella sextelata]